jgi:hypothetical protein
MVAAGLEAVVDWEADFILMASDFDLGEEGGVLIACCRII